MLEDGRQEERQGWLRGQGGGKGTQNGVSGPTCSNIPQGCLSFDQNFFLSSLLSFLHADVGRLREKKRRERTRVEKGLRAVFLQLAKTVRGRASFLCVQYALLSISDQRERESERESGQTMRALSYF